MVTAKKAHKRRPDGTASVGTATDGRHYATIRLPDGTRPRRYGKTDTEALENLQAFLREWEQGRHRPGGRQKLGEYLDWWLSEQVKTGNRHRTYKQRESHIRVHLKPELGTIKLEELRAEDIQRFLARCTAKQLAPRTVSHFRATLRAALNVAMGLRLVDHNAAIYAKPPRIPKSRIKPLDPGEAVKMVERLKDHRLGALFTVVLAVGLRSSEARGLTWDDIDWEKGILTANHQLERIEGSYVLQEEMKNESSVRTVRLPQIAIDTLRLHRARQGEEIAQAGDLWEDNWDLVFTTERGRPLNDSSTTRLFHRLLAESEIRDQRFHDLRHGCASLLIAAGANLKEVSEALGHSSTTITAALYWHLFEAAEVKTASRMDAILGGIPGPMVITEVISPDEAAAG